MNIIDVDVKDILLFIVCKIFYVVKYSMLSMSHVVVIVRPSLLVLNNLYKKIKPGAFTDKKNQLYPNQISLFLK